MSLRVERVQTLQLAGGGLTRPLAGKTDPHLKCDVHPPQPSRPSKNRLYILQRRSGGSGVCAVPGLPSGGSLSCHVAAVAASSPLWGKGQFARNPLFLQNVADENLQQDSDTKRTRTDRAAKNVVFC